MYAVCRRTDGEDVVSRPWCIVGASFFFPLCFEAIGQCCICTRRGMVMALLYLLLVAASRAPDTCLAFDACLYVCVHVYRYFTCVPPPPCVAL